MKLIHLSDQHRGFLEGVLTDHVLEVEEGMREEVWEGDPLLWTPDQAPGQQVTAVSTENRRTLNYEYSCIKALTLVDNNSCYQVTRLRPDGSGVGNLHRDVLLDFCHQLLESLAGEGRLAEHSLVEDDPDTPEVSLGVIEVREEDLRGHVEGGAPQSSLLLILLQVVSEAKVSYLEDGRTGT